MTENNKFLWHEMRQKPYETHKLLNSIEIFGTLFEICSLKWIISAIITMELISNIPLFTYNDDNVQLPPKSLENWHRVLIHFVDDVHNKIV